MKGNPSVREVKRLGRQPPNEIYAKKALKKMDCHKIHYKSLSRLLTMIKNCCLIITVPVKVNLVWLFVSVKRDDVLRQAEAVLAEIVGESQRMIFPPVERKLVHGVLI